MPTPTLVDLLIEYDRALAYTDELWRDLSETEVFWRESEQASGISWHLGHQPAVAHFLVRNLTAAEPLLDPELDTMMDSATPESDRGGHFALERLAGYRDAVAERLRFRIGNIESGQVGAPAQLRVIAHTLMVATINHEYQHDKWIGEVRSEQHGKPLPADPASPFLTTIDGYLVVGA